MTMFEKAKADLEEAKMGRDVRIQHLIDSGMEREDAEAVVASDIAGLSKRVDDLKATAYLNEAKRRQQVAALMAELPAEGESPIYG